MEKNYCLQLYYSLQKNKIKNFKLIITDLFKINKSTLYRWINDYDNNIKTSNFYDFNFLNVTKQIVDYIVSYVYLNPFSSCKKIKKQLNLVFTDNKISLKHIYIIIQKNNLFTNKYFNKTHKINKQIEDFIINQIKIKNTSTAKEISSIVKTKFNISISLTSIYNLFKKHNYTYKKTVVNINPYSFSDQKLQLENVYLHLENNNNCTFNNMYKDNINKMNQCLQNSINLFLNDTVDINNKFFIDLNNKINELNKNTYSELVSIDEFSIITNKCPTCGWSLKGCETIINIPFVKPNKRYSVLMATTNKKIIKYIIKEGSIKNEDFISFIDDLQKSNNNYSYLIDNASIHCSKKSKEYYKKNRINIIYNAPYQSKFNPIEMVFSLLRKKINKKIVKSEKEIKEEIETFVLEIKKETLKNIFNHSTTKLKLYLEQT
jgi:transposase